jgi:hypothetical protein
MSKPKDQLAADAGRLRIQIADAEATLGTLRSKLAKIEAQLAGQSAPENGLEILWKTALPIARTRSSKQQCRVEWNRIPKHERPTLQTALDALRIWNRCEEWKKDGNAYVPGLHRWIKSRQWENLPEGSDRDVAARYRVTPKPIPQTAPEDIATAADVAAAFAPLMALFPSTRKP